MLRVWPNKKARDIFRQVKPQNENRSQVYMSYVLNNFSRNIIYKHDAI